MGKPFDMTEEIARYVIGAVGVLLLLRVGLLLHFSPAAMCDDTYREWTATRARGKRQFIGRRFRENVIFVAALAIGASWRLEPGYRLAVASIWVILVVIGASYKCIRSRSATKWGVGGAVIVESAGSNNELQWTAWSGRMAGGGAGGLLRCGSQSAVITPVAPEPERST